MACPLKPTRSFCTLGDFSSKLLYWTLENTSGNVCISPFGVTIALTMAMAGAGEKTTAQVVSVLSALDDNALYSSCEAVSSLLNSAEADTKVYLGSKIFLSNSIRLNSDFNQTMAEMFSNQVGILDFRQYPLDALLEINDWAKKETDGKLCELVKRGDMDEKSRLILASVIYFCGRWSEGFTRTERGLFRVTEKDTVHVEMMESCRQANYYHSTSPGFQALELPYICRELNLLILLPDQGMKLENLAACISRERLGKLIGNLVPTAGVKISLPKLRLHKSYQLAGALRSMGMERLFDPDLADMSKMSDSAGLCVDKVLHEAIFELSEDGRPPVTATTQHEGPVFRVDRPFLFVLLQHCHHAVVFIGAVRKPS
ncbi:leukocyte elastase inhibitor-like [Ornithodoros turicata]|uniref:leukocyte elastase inhibitor-like n=1 Tax=Ornithodoros turicata TaxID=34597 RepID=UPI003138F97A